MKSLKIIFAIECPVCVYLVLALRGEFQFIDFKLADGIRNVFDKVSKTLIRPNRSEQKPIPACEWDFCQIVRLGRKVLHNLEFRHRKEFPIKRKSPAMVSAADKIGFASLFDQDLATMGAHIRKTFDAVAVFRKQYWLVEHPRQECHG